MVAQGDWPDLAGRIADEDGGRKPVLAVRVDFEDTDVSGVVYHARYLRWCERGRSDFLRLLGNDHKALIDGSDGREPAAFVLRRMSLEFHRPARIDDVLMVETRVAEIGAATLSLDQRVLRDDVAIFEARVLAVLISLAVKPQRLSRRIRAALTGTGTAGAQAEEG